MQLNLVFLFFAHLFLLLMCKHSDAGPLSCTDENGGNVDWFINYKLPLIKKSTNPNYKHGIGYVYFGPESTKWQTMQKSINDPSSAVGRTISNLYTNKSNTEEIAYVLYNDQPPDASAVDDNGHTKGILLTTKDGGIWLQHSVPHFPVPGNTYDYPVTGHTNGQTFLCLTLTIEQVDGIGEILQYTKPNVFNYSIPDSFSELLPTLKKVVQQKFRRSPPWFKLFTLTTPSLTLQIFAKGPKYEKEIYYDWVAPKLKIGLDVQSWLNGARALPSDCQPPFPVYNILMKSVDGEQFSTHKDHSKWAVGGSDSSHAWTCIADLNRMEHQLKRGGAALCTTNKNIWNAFNSTVDTTQPCPRTATQEQDHPINLF